MVRFTSNNTFTLPAMPWSFPPGYGVDEDGHLFAKNLIIVPNRKRISSVGARKNRVLGACETLPVKHLPVHVGSVSQRRFPEAVEYLERIHREKVLQENSADAISATSASSVISEHRPEPGAVNAASCRESSPVRTVPRASLYIFVSAVSISFSLALLPPLSLPSPCSPPPFPAHSLPLPPPSPPRLASPPPLPPSLETALYRAEGYHLKLYCRR